MAGDGNDEQVIIARIVHDEDRLALHALLRAEEKRGEEQFASRVTRAHNLGLVVNGILFPINVA